MQMVNMAAEDGQVYGCWLMVNPNEVITAERAYQAMNGNVLVGMQPYRPEPDWGPPVDQPLDASTALLRAWCDLLNAILGLG